MIWKQLKLTQVHKMQMNEDVLFDEIVQGFSLQLITII